MLATLRYNGAILVVKMPAPTGQLDKSEFMPFDAAVAHFHSQAMVSERVTFDVVCLFAIAKVALTQTNPQGGEQLSMVPFPMESMNTPFDLIEVVSLHPDYRDYIEKAYRARSSGIIV